jgi:hypothetical protein
LICEVFLTSKTGVQYSIFGVQGNERFHFPFTYFTKAGIPAFTAKLRRQTPGVSFSKFLHLQKKP